MANETEPRALGAALAAPAFVTRGHSAALHAANRHVERWAPEAGASRVRSMRALGFVDRLVAPWMETAQRSASLRLFQQYASAGLGERPAGSVSWVFPRPWYQDELDWMAAARRTGAQAGPAQIAPSLLTTRGTYVAPSAPASSGAGSAPGAIAAPPVAMPAALYEYVAPSLSIAASRPAPIAGVGFGGDALPRGEAYSPLVSLAAVQAAELMTRTIAPLVAPRGVAAGPAGATGPGAAAGAAPAGAAAVMTPGLRSVLTSILARAAASQEMPATRLAALAPPLVTPPAPRPDAPVASSQAVGPGLPGGPSGRGVYDEPAAASAMQIAEQYAAQQQRVAELQRIAQQAALREAAARAELARSQPTGAGAVDARAAAQAREAAVARAAAQASEAAAAPAREAAAARAAVQAGDAASQARAVQPGPAGQMTQMTETAELRAAAERAEAELRQHAAAGRATEAQRAADAAASADAERARAALTQTPAASGVEAQRQAEAASGVEAQRQAEATSRVEAQRQAEAASAAAAAERARVEERVAQRLAERGAAQRLHEQARAEAAAHARAAAESARRPGAAGSAEATGVVGPAGSPGAPGAAGASDAFGALAPAAPAEVTAAIAGLPPELAAILGSAVAQRPGRAMQAIHELNQALRTVELLARSSAAGAAFEPIRGPRLVMPAGLGGLVSAVDRAHAIAERPALLGGQRPLAPLLLPQRVAPGAPAADRAAEAPARAAREARVPTLSWLSAEPGPQAIAPTTALGATAAAAPAALSHVAWADRWLARFAGATPQSLETITAAAAAAPAARLRALASAAPGVVFVAPDFLRGELAADAGPEGLRGRPVATAAFAPGSAAAPLAAAAVQPSAPSGRTAAPPAAETAVPRPAPPAEVLRFDDEGETPDDVFAAIAAAASRGRASAARPSAPASGAAVAASAAAAAAAPAATVPATARPMLADLVAHAAPSAPGAGLSAQLASSPFAPALRHVLTLPSAPSFDVRSLFGADLGLTYLAGLIGPASYELQIGAQSAPAWASWSEAALPVSLAADRPDRIDRLVPGFDAAYVHPEAPAGDAAGELGAAGLAGVAGLAGAAGLAGVAGLAGAAGLAGVADVPSSVEAAGAGPTAGAAASPDRLGALTTLRTALLSWELAGTGEPGAPGAQPGALQLVPAAFATAPSLVPADAGSYRDAALASAGAARRMVEAMSLPLLGESAPELPSAWSAPGMLAERAHTWSVAQERSAADLALDFVTPELVLAARVYGLGPAEAAQAARLAIAGPGYLGAMASTVDRTFIEALAIGRDARLEAERHQRSAADGGAPREARAGAPGVPSVPTATAARSAATPAELAALAEPVPAAASAPRAAITTAFPAPGGGIAAAIAPAASPVSPPSGAAFGIDRRAPRGAFLWPSATVAALGMNAAGPDGQLSMSVAALELLAAQVVAELGTYTALSDAHAATLGIAGDGEASSTAAGRGALRTGAAGRELLTQAPSTASADPGAARARQAAEAARSPAALAGRRDAASGPGAEPGEAEVLGAAAALVSASQRARFEALYVALGQSPAGIHWSPAARAARALALAGRGEDGPVTARERAAAAWEVLPVVYGGDLGEPGAAGAATPAGAGAAAGGTAAASASAAIAQAMTSHVAPSWLAGPRPPATAAGARGARRRGGAGPRDREVVGVDFGGADDAGPLYVTGPGLSGLASRAGEALGSYIAPTPPPAAPRERTSEPASVGAVLRPPTAEPEYVQTGRSAGRYGGGEVEIPPWFEAAARKMLAERTGSDGISFAELTLVTAAPPSHIAASTRSAPSAATPAPGTAGPSQSTNPAPQIDIEKLANDVYRNILSMMDVARARNGDPYL
jgi:trimeric autotransporter adhesin